MDTSDPDIQRELKKHPRRTVAVVFLVGPDSTFLFVRTKRLPKQWQPIGGGIKPGDGSILAGAMREVKEEVGLVLSDIDLHEVFSTPYDFGHGTVHFFVAKISGKSDLSFDDNELEEWKWVSLTQASQLPIFPATARCLTFLSSSPHLLDGPSR